MRVARAEHALAVFTERHCIAGIYSEVVHAGWNVCVIDWRVVSAELSAALNSHSSQHETITNISKLSAVSEAREGVPVGGVGEWADGVIEAEWRIEFTDRRKEW